MSQTPDADEERFKRELALTPHGKRLSVALKQVTVALNALQSLRSYHVRNPWTAAARDKEETWQRSYLNASERARLAMDVLYKQFGWPSDGQYDETFTWAPSPGSRQSRTKP